MRQKMGNNNQAIYDITRDVAQQQREIEALKYKLAILERDKHEGTSMTYSTEKDIAWAEAKAKYAQPNSMIDTGGMYYWANYWHEQCCKAINSGLSYCRLSGELQKEIDEVREMTVEEVARIICSQKGYDPDALYMPHHLIKKIYEWQRFSGCARALAKLGTIRIVGE